MVRQLEGEPVPGPVVERLAGPGFPGGVVLELTGFFGAVGRDPLRSYSEILSRMSIGFGDDALATARSLSTARRRAVRADRTEAASAR